MGSYCIMFRVGIKQMFEKVFSKWVPDVPKLVFVCVLWHFRQEKFGALSHAGKMLLGLVPIS